MFDPEALTRMSIRAVDNAIGCIERDLSTLGAEIKVFDLTPQDERTARLILSIDQVKTVHERLYYALAALEELRATLSAPLPQIHAGQDANCSICRAVRIANAVGGPTGEVIA